MMVRGSVVGLLLILSLLYLPAAQASVPTRWPVAKAESVGLDPKLVEGYRSLCEQSGADSCLIIRRGKVVMDWYSPAYRTRGYCTMMSSTKAITGLLVVMLVEDGKIKSLDEPVGNYLPEWKGGRRAAVTIRHLLAHTSGLDIGQDPERSVGSRSDKSAYVRSLIPAQPPGIKFSYSNEGVQLLSPLIAKAAGEPVNAYASRRLFTPLGLTHTRFYEYPLGDAWTYADMRTVPQEFARFGQLMLNGGVWQGKRLVSKQWVDRLTAQAQPFEPTSGLLWWREPDTNSFAALGYRATNMHVFPATTTVVVRTQRQEGGMSEQLYNAKAVPFLKHFAGRRATDADVANVLVASALDALQRGRLEETLRTIEVALKMRTLPRVQRAEILFIATAAAYRHDRMDDARRYWSWFKRHQAALPPGHWVLVQREQVESWMNEGRAQAPSSNQ